MKIKRLPHYDIKKKMKLNNATKCFSKITRFSKWQENWLYLQPQWSGPQEGSAGLLSSMTEWPDFCVPSSQTFSLEWFASEEPMLAGSLTCWNYPLHLYPLCYYYHRNLPQTCKNINRSIQSASYLGNDKNSLQHL